MISFVMFQTIFLGHISLVWISK